MLNTGKKDRKGNPVMKAGLVMAYNQNMGGTDRVDQQLHGVHILRKQSPSMELTLSWRGGLSTKKFQPECVNEESSTEHHSLRRQANRSSQPCQDL